MEAAQQALDAAFDEMKQIALQQGFDIAQVDSLLIQLHTGIDEIQRRLSDFSIESEAYQQVIAQLNEYATMQDSLRVLQQRYAQQEQIFIQIQKELQEIDSTLLQVYGITVEQLPEKISALQKELALLQEQLSATDPESEDYLILSKEISDKERKLGGIAKCISRK